MFVASGLRKDIHPVKISLHYLQRVLETVAGRPVNRQIIMIMRQFIRHSVSTVKMNLLASKTLRPCHLWSGCDVLTCTAEMSSLCHPWNG